MLSSIAFIPDGNRRYAKLNGLSLAEAYRLGVKKAWQTIKWFEKYPSIKVGSFYALSLKNLQRHKYELRLLFRIFEKEFERVKESDYFEREGIRIKFIGRIDLLGKRIQRYVREIEEYTANFNNRLINIALGYDGKREIVDAARQIAMDYKEEKIDLEKLDEKRFTRYLYHSFPEPDLIIRTSGEQRLSGFLTYMSAYSELYFCRKYWPEFSMHDLKNAIQDYERRERRFGK